MGVAASPPPEAAAPADPPAKEDAQHGSATDVAAAAPPEAAAPAESPAKEEAQSAAAASDAPGGEADAAGETVVLDAAAEGGEEEEGECGFCLYMKGGGCKDEFVGWEKCVEQAEEEGGDVVERCHDATAALRRCMDKFPDYYEPILRAERAMAADLEAFKAEDEASKASPASPPAPAAEEEQGDNKKQAEAVVAKEKEDLAV